MSTVHSPPRNCLLLHEVDWQTYSQLLRTFAERPAVRLTYDRGDLEIMSPLREHEDASYLVGRFIAVLTEELDLPMSGGGSTTLRRRKKQRGLEPDECYWITNEAKVRGKKRLNLRVDPPPDLAIEVDVTRSSLNRMGIYARLGVPEVWRLDDGQTLTFHVLGKDSMYAEATHSLAFPLITPADLLAFLPLRLRMDHTTVVRQFREWLRQKRAAPPSGSS